MDKNINLLADHKPETPSYINIVGKVYKELGNNVAKPFINTAVIEPVDSIVDLANLTTKAIDKTAYFKDIAKYKVENAKFLSLDWFAQTLSAGIGFSIPFGLSTKISELGLGKLAVNLNEDSKLALLAQKPIMSQMVGAIGYGAIMTPPANQTRLSDSVSSALGFGVFGLSNGVTGDIISKTGVRALTGALGGIVGETSATLISQHKLPNSQELLQASVSGAALNSVFSALTDTSSNLKISDEKFINTAKDSLGKSDLADNNLFRQLSQKNNDASLGDLDKARQQFQIASSLIKTIKDSGFDAKIVGGSVRDLVLNKLPKDFDIATSATPSELDKIFAQSGIKTLPVGKSFGVTIVNIDGHQFELATLRQDGNYADGRRPDSVNLVRDFRTDALRRDFTINSIYLDPNTGHFDDYCNGLDDLKNKVIRAVGNPYDRINEDKLRMLRAVRFATKLDGFSLDDTLSKAIKDNASDIKSVSPQRITAELRQILLSPNVVKGLDYLTDLGLMTHILPELDALSGPKGTQDPTFHPEGNVWTHTKMVEGELTKFNNRDFSLMMAGLLHDVAKPQPQEIQENGRITNYGHAELGSEMAQSIARRLKLSNEETNQIRDLVNLHMKMHEVTKMRPSSLTRILLRPDIDNLIALEHADSLGRGGGPYTSNYDFLQKALNDLRSNIQGSGSEPKTSLEIKPIITGQTLIELGLKPNPAFKVILSDSYNAQLDGAFDSPQAASAWLSSYLNKTH